MLNISFKDKSILDYKIQDREKHSSTIDFNLKEDKDYKLFNDIKDIQSYSKELRANGWKYRIGY